MKEEKLRRILHAFEEQKPEDVSFHHDSSGTFRGMAFVKYSSIQDASFVFDHINSIDVGGRPIKVFFFFFFFFLVFVSHLFVFFFFLFFGLPLVAFFLLFFWY